MGHAGSSGVGLHRRGLDEGIRLREVQSDVTDKAKILEKLSLVKLLEDTWW
jgi:hypothetical protein